MVGKVRKKNGKPIRICLDGVGAVVLESKTVCILLGGVEDFALGSFHDFKVLRFSSAKGFY